MVYNYVIIGPRQRQYWKRGFMNCVTLDGEFNLTHGTLTGEWSLSNKWEFIEIILLCNIEAVYVRVFASKLSSFARGLPFEPLT